MNVLEAIEKMDELNGYIEALEKATTRLEMTGSDNHEARLLGEIREKYQEEVDKLKFRLEKTPLINVR